MLIPRRQFLKLSGLGCVVPWISVLADPRCVVAAGRESEGSYGVNFVDVTSQARLTETVYYGGMRRLSTSSNQTAAEWPSTTMTMTVGWTSLC